MRLELKRQEPKNGAIPGELYADGLFFGYTLESEKDAFPVGVYELYPRFSPKFQKNKVHIRIPGRDFIMFHGANRASDLAGCVGVAYTRTSENTIFGDISDELNDLFEDAGKSGVLVVTDAKGAGDFWGVLWRFAAVLGLGAGVVYLITKNN